jgi:hypothetical protein
MKLTLYYIKLCKGIEHYVRITVGAFCETVQAATLLQELNSYCSTFPRDAHIPGVLSLQVLHRAILMVHQNCVLTDFV